MSGAKGPQRGKADAADAKVRRSRPNPKLLHEIHWLKARLLEAERGLSTIRGREEDATIASRGDGEGILSLTGTDLVYRLIVETMQEAALTVTFEGKILFANTRFGLFIETPVERVIGRFLVDFTVPDDREALFRLIKDGRSRPAKTRIVFQGSTREIPANVSAGILQLPDGPSICIVASDLSKLEASTETVQRLRLQQEMLEKSRERFQLLSETAGELLQSKTPLAIVNSLCRRVMKTLDCQIFFNYLVQDGKDRLKMNAFAGISEKTATEIDTLEFGVAVCGCVARDGVRIVAENIRAGGDPRTEQLLPMGVRAFACHPLIAHGKLLGTLAFGARNRSTFSASDLDLMKTVADQVSIALERTHTEEALKWMNSQLEGRVKERMSDLARTVKKLEREAGIRRETEDRLRTTNEELERRAGQLRNLAGELVLAEQRERHRLAGVLHDHLQQLLVSARYQLDTLAKETVENPREIVEKVDELLGRSIEFSHSLTAELSPPILHEGGLVQALQWLTRWMGKNYGLVVRLSAGDSQFLAGEDITILLYQSVRELLFNVVKHSRARYASLQISRRANELRIKVSDKGIGFDPACLGEKAGTEGYGLFSIRERMGLVGGRLEISSAPGKGSRFTLAVPTESLEPASASRRKRSVWDLEPAHRPRSPVTRREGRKIRVLLADDHKITREGLAQLIGREEDIEVIGEASDGEAAVQQTIALEPDIVVMDVNMPAMSGIEATRLIHEQLPDVRVVALSMLEEEAAAFAMRLAGASAYVSKAASPRLLLEAIRSLAARDTRRRAVTS